MGLIRNLFGASESQPNPVVRFTKLKPTATQPVYSTPGASGMDLFAAETAIVGPLQQLRVDIGIAVEIPTGSMGLIIPRSGLALKRGITLLNSPGLIDSDYRGSLSALIWNTSQRDFEIQIGDRIAQLVIAPFVSANLVEASALTETQRGQGGWGSTGVHNLYSFNGVPFPDKCKRKRNDGPTPCLMCPDECYGDAHLEGAAFYEVVDNIPKETIGTHNTAKPRFNSPGYDRVWGKS